MRTILAALTALILFATPVVAVDLEDARAAWNAGDSQKALRLYETVEVISDQFHAKYSNSFV